MMQKKLFSLVWVAVLLLSACTQAEPQTADMEKWLKTANLSAQETPQELYEKALEEDTLIVYSISTRVMDVKKSFEARYPGLTVFVHDIRGSDLFEKLRSNYDSRDYACDIVLCSDNDGKLSFEFVKQGIVYKYVPYDIADKLIPGANGPTLLLMGEVQQIFYNTQVYSTPPIHNWWQLTEKTYRGKVVMPNPLKSLSTMGLLCMMVKNDALMEKAYVDLYGKAPTLPDGENAGQYFIRRLVENGLVLVNSGDEVAELIGLPGQKDPPIGMMISSKVRLQELGYCIAPILDMGEFCGTDSPNSIMIAGGSKNINSAKLFIRWILGEADGHGEGYKPYLQNGAWSVRTDVSSDSPVALKDLKLLELDSAYMHEHQAEIVAFWLKLMETHK